MKHGTTLRTSEVFYSIEGEGLCSGAPTIFIRTFGCNFTCPGFSNEERAEIVPPKIDSLDQFVPIERGCDSIYSWHPSYKHLTKDYTVDQLFDKIEELSKGLQRTPNLSFTGGEPLLHQKFLTEFFTSPRIEKYSVVRFETNGTIRISESFFTALDDWAYRSSTGLYFANSPKLSNSGEPHDKAIQPAVLLAQYELENVQPYYKFVSDGSDESFAEIEDTVKQIEEYFRMRLTTLDMSRIYVMPEGSTREQQERNQLHVAEQCLKHGFNFTARVHCFVFGNKAGT